MTLTAVLSKNARSTEVLPAFRGYLEGGRLAVVDSGGFAAAGEATPKHPGHDASIRAGARNAGVMGAAG